MIHILSSIIKGVNNKNRMTGKGKITSARNRRTFLLLFSFLKKLCPDSDITKTIKLKTSSNRSANLNPIPLVIVEIFIEELYYKSQPIKIMIKTMIGAGIFLLDNKSTVTAVMRRLSQERPLC